MKISLKALGLAAAVTVVSAGSALAAVATTAVNVRSGPGTSYHVVDTLRAGEWVDVGRQSGGWCYVTHSGPDGWVSCRYLGGASRPSYPMYRDRYYGPDFYRPYHRYPSPGMGFGFGGPYGGYFSFGF